MYMHPRSQVSDIVKTLAFKNTKIKGTFNDLRTDYPSLEALRFRHSDDCLPRSSFSNSNNTKVHTNLSTNLAYRKPKSRGR